MMSVEYERETDRDTHQNGSDGVCLQIADLEIPGRLKHLQDLDGSSEQGCPQAREDHGRHGRDRNDQ